MCEEIELMLILELDQECCSFSPFFWFNEVQQRLRETFVRTRGWVEVGIAMGDELMVE